MGFGVTDVAATVKALQDQGVVFEDYDFPGLRTVNGVAELGGSKAAWFKDTDLGTSRIMDRARIDHLVRMPSSTTIGLHFMDMSIANRVTQSGSRVLQ